MDVFEKRRAYLRGLVDESFGGSQSELAGRLEVQPNLISRYLLPPSAANHKNIGERSARSIEAKLGLQPGAMDGTGTPSAVADRADRSMYFGVPNSAEEAEVGREWGKIEDEDVRQQLKTMIYLLVAKQKNEQRGKGSDKKRPKRENQTTTVARAD